MPTPPVKAAKKPAKKPAAAAEASRLVGKKAPAFALPDQDGNTVKLTDFAGKWLVLYFYPKDDTPGCTTEACEFTAGLRGFEKLDAAVLGCSPDKPERHKKFIAKYELGFPLLSDESRATLAKYGAWGTKSMYGRTMEGVIRSTVIVAPDGKVAEHWGRVKAAGHAEQVRAKLAELRAGA